MRYGKLKVKSVFKPCGHQARNYPGFCSIKRLGVPLLILPPPWIGCLFITGSPPAVYFALPIYTLGWREAL